jgi:transposase
MDSAPVAHERTRRPSTIVYRGVVFWVRTRGDWRDLPDRFGNWNRIGRRLDRGSQASVWKKIFEALPDPDREGWILDSAIIRAPLWASTLKVYGRFI